jgi:uncharacterized protein (TIGR03089 family)
MASAVLTTLLAGGVAGAERPLLTYCDDATGERIDLTAMELGGWAARTAGLLRQGCHLEPGDRAAVLLPPHWQTAAVLLGAWSIGVAVLCANLDRGSLDARVAAEAVTHVI